MEYESIEVNVSLSLNFGVSPALTTLSLQAIHSMTSVKKEEEEEGKEREGGEEGKERGGKRNRNNGVKRM